MVGPRGDPIEIQLQQISFLKSWFEHLLCSHDDRIYLDGGRTTTLLYKNISPKLYSRKGGEVSVVCETDGQRETRH